jgi:hypothetical protein
LSALSHVHANAEPDTVACCSAIGLSEKPPTATIDQHRTARKAIGTTIALKTKNHRTLCPGINKNGNWMTKLRSETGKKGELQYKIANHTLGGNVGARRKLVRYVEERGPDGSNHLNRQRTPRRRIDPKPKHGKNTPTDDTEIRQIHAETTADENRKRKIETGSHRALKGNWDGDEDEPDGYGDEGLLPVQAARKEGRGHLPDCNDKRIREPICDVVVHLPCSILARNGIKV